MRRLRAQQHRGRELHSVIVPTAITSYDVNASVLTVEFIVDLLEREELGEAVIVATDAGSIGATEQGRFSDDPKAEGGVGGARLRLDEPASVSRHRRSRDLAAQRSPSPFATHVELGDRSVGASWGTSSSALTAASQVIERACDNKAITHFRGKVGEQGLREVLPIAPSEPE